MDYRHILRVERAILLGLVVGLLINPLFIGTVNAIPIIDFVSPTLGDNSNTPESWVYVNTTSNELLNLSYLEWGNQSGLTNVSMSYNISTTNWYINMTGLVDYTYNYTVWAQNSTSEWNQSARLYVTVDTIPPAIYVDSPGMGVGYIVGDVPLNVFADETISTWKYSLNGGPNIIFTPNTTLTSLANGSHNITVWANDSAGNLNSSIVYFGVDVPILADTAWPMFHHDLNHTGQSPYNGSQTNNVKWTYNTGNLVESSPSIASDGTIIFGSYDYNIYALYPNGTKKWNYTTGSDVTSSPAIASDGTIYVGSGDQNIYALYPNGTKKWNYTTGFNVISSPAIASDGTIYFGMDDNNTYALYPNGTQKWNYTTGNWVYSSPAIASDGTIYIGSYDNKLYAFGGPVWNTRTGQSYDTIQEAINNATAGDTINVSAGTYNENLDIPTSINLVGAGASLTTLNAMNSSDYGITVSANSVNLSGFTITGATDTNMAGISLSNSNYSSIENNTITNNYDGIAVSYSYYTIVKNNTVSNIITNGILLTSSSNNNVTLNNVTDTNGQGISLSNADYNILNENDVQDNQGDGFIIMNSDFNEFTNNTVNSNGQCGGFCLIDSNSNKVANNTANSNTGGVILSNSFVNNITENTISSTNGNGIFINVSTDNIIANNTVTNSTVNGISLENSYNHTIYNNFFNNTNNAGFTGTNSNDWNTTNTTGTNIAGGPLIGGNLWSYPNGTGFSETCSDLDSDGYCDSYYNISSGNIDYLPLAKTVGQDFILPTITVDSLANGTTYSTTSVELNVSADETTDSWWYEYNGNGTNITFTPNATIFAGGADGLKNITVWTNDSAGNENYSVVYFTLGTNTSPNATNLAVTPSLDGWGATFAYNVTINDPENDTVTCILYTNTTGTLVVQGNSSVIGGSGVCSVEVSTFGTSDYDYNQSNPVSFMFNIDDGVSGNEFNTSLIYAPSFEKDDLQTYYISGNNSQVNRSAAETVPLIVRIYDADRGTYSVANVTVSFNATTDGSSYVLAGSNLTNTTGHANYYFDPPSSYQVGQQNWTAFVEGESYYKSAAWPQFDLNIYGSLLVNLEQPTQNQSVSVGNPVTVRFNLSTDNSTLDLQASAGVIIEFGLNGSQAWSESCSVQDEGTGWYNCTWDTTALSGGLWDMKINASKSYYNDNISIFTDWINLSNSAPTGANLNVNPPSGGWGENFTFNVNVSDTQNDDVTCTLFITTDGGSTWQNKGGNTVSNTLSGTICEVNTTFTSADMTTPSNATFKFQIKDSTPGNVLNTSNQSGPIIEENDVIVTYITGNNTEVNRTGTQYTELTIRIYDNDSNTYSSGINGTTWVTVDGANFDSGTTNPTNATGFTVYSFDPSCSYSTGPQKWTGGATDSRYKNLNLTEKYTITVTGDFNTSFIFPTAGSRYLRSTDNITYEGSIIDDCGLDETQANVTFTAKHQTTNTTYVCSPGVNLGNDRYQCEINTSGWGAGWYDLTMNVSKAYFNSQSITSTSRFFVGSKPTTSNQSEIPTLGGWGEVFYFNVTVTDEDLDNLSVYLDLYDPDFGWRTNLNGTSVIGINQTITLTYNQFNVWYTSGQENWMYRFDVRDNSSDCAGSYCQVITSQENFTIEQDDVRIEYVQGSGSSVWRNGTHIQTLKVQAYDDDTNTTIPAATFVEFWVTVNGSDWGTGVLNSTNATGHVTYYLNPDCSYSTGVQNWIAGTAGNAKYKDLNSSNFTINITGELRPKIDSPTGESFLRGANVPIFGSITDDCGNYVIGANTLTYTLYNDGGGPYGPYAAFNLGNGSYNYTWDSTARPYQYYNITMAASESFYADNSTTEINAFYLASQPSLANSSVVNSDDGGWGENYTFNVQLTDSDADDVNITLWYKNTSTTNWIFLDSTIDTSGSTSTRFISFNGFYFNYTDIGSNDYKFTAEDPWNYTDEVNSSFTILKDDIIVASITSTPGPNINRLTENTSLTARFYDTDRGAFVEAGVNGKVWVTEDGATYSLSLDCNTSATGWCSISYDPSCTSSVGIQNYTVGVTDLRYNNANNTDSINVIGQLITNITNPENGTIFNHLATEYLNTTGYDDCGQTFNDTQVNVTWLNGTDPDIIAYGINTSWFIPGSYGRNNDSTMTGPNLLTANAIKIGADSSYYDEARINGYNDTIFAYIYGWAEVDSASPINNLDGQSYPASSNIMVTCRVIDSNIFPNHEIAGYSVEFFKNGVSVYNVTTNTTGEAPWFWNTSIETDGYYNISCEIKDNSSLYYNVSVAEQNATVQIDGSLPIVTIKSPINGTSYNTTTIELNATADEAINTWWYQYNSNGTNITFTPNGSLYVGLGEGLRNVTVWANDTAGNENSSIRLL